jgi:3-phenylpropionate/trans-cinnamate dioxygenase ferredoxin reductase subunit
MGITVHLDVGVTSVESRDGRAYGVTLTTGRHMPTDVVVLGLGIRPRTELASKAGLDVADGIVVNEFLETSDPAISAIGDCCSFPYAFDGRRIRLESVQNATDQARNVAKRLTGVRAPYRQVPWFWSDQGGMKLQMAGVTDRADAREVVCGDRSSGRFSVLRYDEGRLVCGESVNNTGDHVALRTLVQHGAEDGIRHQLAEPAGVDLRRLARDLRHQRERAVALPRTD